MTSLPARFWAKVNKTDTCWLWTGCLNERGYGKYLHNGKTGRVHRIGYAALVGPIPCGMQVDHTCHVRRCVNPDHLQLVNARGNAENRRGAIAGNRSGLRGVSWSEASHAWRVTAQSRGKSYWGGQYANLDDAERAAIDLRNRLMTNNLADRRKAS